VHNFVNGIYRGNRLKMMDGRSQMQEESYGEYTIKVFEPSKSGVPRVSVNGGRAKMVHAHSSGASTIDGQFVRTERSCMVYDPDYVGRFLVDDVKISADPTFLVKEL